MQQPLFDKDSIYTNIRENVIAPNDKHPFWKTVKLALELSHGSGAKFRSTEIVTNAICVTKVEYDKWASSTSPQFALLVEYTIPTKFEPLTTIIIFSHDQLKDLLAGYAYGKRDLFPITYDKDLDVPRIEHLYDLGSIIDRQLNGPPCIASANEVLL